MNRIVTGLLVSLLISVPLVNCEQNSSVLHPDLLELKGAATSDVTITLKGFDEIINSITRQSFETRGNQLEALVSGLENHAVTTQTPILTFLKTQQTLFPNLRFEGYWISNQILVYGANKPLLSVLRLFDLIARISPQASYALAPLIPNIETHPNENWGLEQIRAPEMWRKGIDGKGIVVGSIDTGVRGTHEALKDNYVGGDFGWFDPSGKSPKVPTDTVGHGSHTTGIMVGKKNIGVAPSAKWMACRGCSSDQCTNKDLLKCAQFMLCPTTFDGKVKNCGKAPNIINNSWGGGEPGDKTFENVIKAWVAGDIFPVFSVGNSGPKCSSVGSPADTDSSFITSVGASGKRNELASFSSKGPDFYKKIKPELCAPGVNIYSSMNNSDSAYAELSGTSMAAPHVSGVFALMRQKYPNITYSQAQKKLFNGAKKVHNLSGSGSAQCGNISNVKFPNNNFGHGIIDAVNAIN